MIIQACDYSGVILTLYLVLSSIAKGTSGINPVEDTAFSPKSTQHTLQSQPKTRHNHGTLYANLWHNLYWRLMAPNAGFADIPT